MMKPLILLAFLMLPLELTSASDDSEGQLDTHIQWRLSLDASGKIASLVQSNPDSRATAVGAQLESVVRGWHFTPGKLDGQPAATETTLTVHVLADPSDADHYHVRILSATTGAGLQHTVPPEYPKPAIRMGRDGAVWIRVDHDADGRILSTVPVPYPEAPHVDGALTRAAIDAVKHWTLQPETVAGHGVAGSVVASFCFSLEGRANHCYRETKSGTGEPADSRYVIPLTSVASVDMGTTIP